MISRISRFLTLLLALALLTVPSAAPAEDAPFLPDDPLLADQYGLDLHRVPEAWMTTTGGGVTVAVIDSGVDLDHPDLVDNVVTGVNFVGCEDAPDGCGSGDWQDGPDVTAADEGSQHGTHVAGIIAATANNRIGVAGVAPNATILPVRVLDKGGSGSATLAAKAIIWSVDNGADVINLSLGGLVPGGVQYAVGFYAEAVAYAAANDVSVIAAAGNSSQPICADPAFSESVMCVIAVDRHGRNAAYSNYGVEPELNTVAAAGGGYQSLGMIASTRFCAEAVISTVPAGTGVDYDTASGYCALPVDLGYDAFSGTSMASPHVAGVAALLRSAGCDAAQTAQLIRDTAVNPVTGEPGPWTPTLGNGVVDAAGAMAAAATTCAGETTGAPMGPLECTTGARFEPAEGLPGGWSVDTADNPSGTAAWAPVVDDLGGSAWMSATDGPGRKDDRLVTHGFTAGDHTSLRFTHRYAFEDTSRFPADHDGGVVEIAVDGGDWEHVPREAFTVAGYGGALLSPGGQGLDETDTPAAGQGAFIENSGGLRSTVGIADALTVPRREQVDLSQWSGHEVRLRWRVSQGTNHTVEAADSPGIAWWIHGVELINLPVEDCP